MRIYRKENGNWNYLSFLTTSGPGYEPHVSIDGEQIFYLWVERIPGEIYCRYQYVGDNDFISKICNISITRNFDSCSPFYAGKYVFWSEEIDYETGRKYDIVYLSLFDKAQESTTFINWSNSSYTNSRFPQVIYHKEGGSYYVSGVYDGIWTDEDGIDSEFEAGIIWRTWSDIPAPKEVITLGDTLPTPRT